MQLFEMTVPVATVTLHEHVSPSHRTHFLNVRKV